MNKRIAYLAIILVSFLVGCQGATDTPPPPPTPQVIFVVATPLPTDTPLLTAFPTALPTATATVSQAPRTPTRTKTATRAPATATRPRATATGVAPTTVVTPAPPGTLSDGSYSSSGSIRVEFIVSGGGTVASGGFFNYHCSVDGALSTYGFTDPAAIVGGKFAFSGAPSPSGDPRVSLVCSATASTQARCTIRNLLATQKCLDTPVTVSRK